VRLRKPNYHWKSRRFWRSFKTTLDDKISDVKPSNRLTESAVCLVAPEHGPNRQFERLPSAAGRLDKAAKPILEINPRHERIARESGHSAAALAASMGKAKLLGFLAEQPAVGLNFNYSQMTEEELRSEIANLHEQARAIKRGQFIDH
jgi:HSP90 family molecular chaperone